MIPVDPDGAVFQYSMIVNTNGIVIPFYKDPAINLNAVVDDPVVIPGIISMFLPVIPDFQDD